MQKKRWSNFRHAETWSSFVGKLLKSDSQKIKFNSQALIPPPTPRLTKQATFERSDFHLLFQNTISSYFIIFMQSINYNTIKSFLSNILCHYICIRVTNNFGLECLITKITKLGLLIFIRLINMDGQRFCCSDFVLRFCTSLFISRFVKFFSLYSA